MTKPEEVVEEKLAQLALKAGTVASQVDQSLLDELRTQLGEDNVKQDSQLLMTHGLDISHEQAAPASIVVYPANSEQVVWLVKRLPQLTVYGAGSSMDGQVMAKGTVSVDLSRMNRMLEFDERFGVVRVEAGIRLDDLNRQLKGAWIFPVDPSYNGTVGGLLVTDARGPSTVKWGGLYDYLQKVKIVTSSGNTMELVNTAPLMVGSQGRTGIVTEVQVKLVKLVKGRVGRVTFKELNNAIYKASEWQDHLISAQLLNPSMVRLLNRYLEQSWPEDHTLLVETKDPNVEMAEVEQTVHEVCQHAWTVALKAGMKAMPVRSRMLRLPELIPEMIAMAVTPGHEEPALLSNLFDGSCFIFGGPDATLGDLLREDDGRVQSYLFKAFDPDQKFAH